jgi:hypothetical protein
MSDDSLKDAFNGDYPDFFETHTMRGIFRDFKWMAVKVADNCYQIEYLSGQISTVREAQRGKPARGFFTFKEAVSGLLEREQGALDALLTGISKKSENHFSQHAEAAGVELANTTRHSYLNVFPHP